MIITCECKYSKTIEVSIVYEISRQNKKLKKVIPESDMTSNIRVFLLREKEREKNNCKLKLCIKEGSYYRQRKRGIM